MHMEPRKHRRRAEVVLDKQHHSTHTPTYNPGETISGVLLLPEPSSVEAVEVTVQGHIRVSFNHDGLVDVDPHQDWSAEFVEGSSKGRELLNASAASWHAGYAGEACPPAFPFSVRIPRRYRDEKAGAKLLLPPSHHAPASAAHRFGISVEYAVVATVRRRKRYMAVGRKCSTISVPFLLSQETRPRSAAPFPPLATRSSAGPQTIFSFNLLTSRSELSLEAHVYLPASQVFCIHEPVPFFVTICGHEELLAPPTSVPQRRSLFDALLRRRQASKVVDEPVEQPPLAVSLRRTTTIAVPLAGGRITSTETIGAGAMHEVVRGLKSATWAGALALDPSVAHGGFSAAAVRVQDSLVLDLRVRDGGRAGGVEVQRAIPVRLATRPHGCLPAVPLSGWI